MRRAAVLAIFGMLAFGQALVTAAPVTGALVAKQQAAASSETSAQRRTPRIRVYPQGGRLLYRDCDFRLVPEWRPSGTVIVPRQRCWWVRG